MNQPFSWIFIPLFLLVNITLGQSLDPYEYLQKAKKRTQGLSLTQTERIEIETLLNQRPGYLNQYLSQKIFEYVSSPYHAEKLASHLSKKFLIPKPLIDEETFRKIIHQQRNNSYLLQILDSKKQTQNIDHTNNDQFTITMNSSPSITPIYNLFRSLVLENKSWDELLIGHEYTVQPGNQLVLDFYSGINPQLSRGLRTSSPDEYEQNWVQINGSLPFMKLKFAPNDPRVAGALTTPEFFYRYINSTINKNRQRAAAINRIFMCNDLQPSIPLESDTIRVNKALDQMLLNEVKNHSNKNINYASELEKTHGNNPNCHSCHRIIDPAGKHFGASRIIPHSDSFAGALVYDDENGKEITFKTSSLRDYAYKVTQTPNYANCQVKHLWEWYIGTDVPLYEGTTRHKEVLKAFNSGKRRTKDFIHFLLRQPEFYNQPAKELEITYKQVAPILKKCTSCHTYEGPNLNQYPFSTDPTENNDLLKNILFRLDLPAHNKKSMPQDRHEWNDEEIYKIKKWIEEGAKL